MDARPNPNAPAVNESHPDWIVVDDPSGEWNEGSLVDAVRAKQLSSRGVTLLPVVPEYFRMSGVGGYFHRSWGSGFPLSNNVPMFAAPITIYADPTRVGRTAAGTSTTISSVLNWRARIVNIGEEKGEGAVYGTLRMAADTGQSHSRYATVVPGSSRVVDIGKLGKPEKDRNQWGWTVGGDVTVNVPNPGHFGFGLYGMGPGLAIAWIAASMTLASR
jgi:hypothetical protein